MNLSEHIKQKRKKNGLSQVELAEREPVWALGSLETWNRVSKQ